MKRMAINATNSFFISLCTLLYIGECIIYYLFISASNEIYNINYFQDLDIMLGACLIKILIVLAFVYIIKKNGICKMVIFKYLSMLSLVTALSYLYQMILYQISIGENLIVSLRILLPIVINLVLAIIFAGSVFKTVSEDRKIKLDS